MTPQSITMTGKYQTRDGEPARILCVDAPGDKPVIAIAGARVCSFTHSGYFYQAGTDHQLNLVPAPVTHEIDVWVNVFADGATSVFISREYADASYARQDVRGVKRFACVNIKRTVTEGEGI